MKHHEEVQHFNIPVDLSMYDRLPYKLNPAICTKTNISLTSGNVIKGYHVKMDEEKHIIDPMNFNLDNSTSNENINVSLDSSSNEDNVEFYSEESDDNSNISEETDEQHYEN